MTDMHLEALKTASARVDYHADCSTSATRKAQIYQGFQPSSRQNPISSNFPSRGKINDHERVLSREGSFRSSLDRHAVQLPRHARFRLSFPERAVRDDRAGDR